MTRPASGPPSSGRNVRPRAACAPRVSKNDVDTALTVKRTGESRCTSMSPQVVDPIAAMSLKEFALVRQSLKFGSETSICGLLLGSSFSHMRTSRSWLSNGRGRSRTVLTTVKSATAAPIPRLIVSAATTVKPGRLRSMRAPYRTSCHVLSTNPQPHMSRVTSLTRRMLPNSFRAARCASSGESPASIRRSVSSAKWVLISASSSSAALVRCRTCRTNHRQRCRTMAFAS